MKFSINSSLLKSCIARIQGGLGGITLASQSIKMEVLEDRINFYTNNIKIGYIYGILDASIDSQGEAVVDGSSFTRFINAAISDVITIENKSGFLYIYDGRRKVNLTILPNDEFIVPKVANKEVAKVDINVFQIMLKSAIHMAASNNTIFDGIHISSDMISATDQTKAVILPFKSGIEESIIITKEAAKEIMKLNHEEPISLMCDSSFLTINIEGEKEALMVTMQLIAGQYPDLGKFREITNYVEYVVVDIDELYAEANYISLISDNSEQVCQMTISNEGTISFEANAHLGTNRLKTEVDFDITASVLPEENFLFNLKVSSVLSMLRSIKEFSESSFFDNDNVKIYFNSIEKPIRLEADGLSQFLSAIRNI